MKGNVFKVLKRRGYKIQDEENSEDENIQFILNFLNEEKQGKVIYYTKKIGIEQFSEILAPYINQKLQIIVIYDEVTNPVLNSFKQTVSKYAKSIELIHSIYFAQDIMSHQLVPKYVKLDQKEKERIMAIYKTTEDLFPQLLTTDPICIIMGFQVGDMIKVISSYNFTTKQVDNEQPPMITYCAVSSGEY